MPVITDGAARVMDFVFGASCLSLNTALLPIVTLFTPVRFTSEVASPSKSKEFVPEVNNTLRTPAEVVNSNDVEFRLDFDIL